MKDAVRVMIGTPAYGGMVHLSYVRSISDYHRTGIPVSIAGIANESLITRARNAIISKFYHRSDFTHLLFLDGDVYLGADALEQLLGHNVDAVGAATSLKGKNELGERIFSIGPTVGEEGDLHAVERIATGSLLLSRRAVNALVEEAVADGRTYSLNTSNSESDAPTHFDVFQVGVVEGEYLSEDYWVCAQLWDLGIPVYLDPEVATFHYGTREF